MVRATIREIERPGTGKTMTRRIIKLPTKGQYIHPKMGGWASTTVGGGGCFTIDRQGNRHPAPEKVAIWHQTTGFCISAPHQSGDRLWVRETCRAEELCDGRDGVRYLADDAWLPIENIAQASDAWLTLYHYRTGTTEKRGQTVPQIHMPRWAARLILTVTEVRVERLDQITEQDAIAEGMDCDEPVASFIMLWNNLNASRGFPWSSNPFVCVVTFRPGLISKSS